MQNLNIKYSVLKFFVSIHFSKQNVLVSFSFPNLPVILSEMFHFEHKTMFLNHCNNQKIIILFIINQRKGNLNAIDFYLFGYLNYGVG